MNRRQKATRFFAQSRPAYYQAASPMDRNFARRMLPRLVFRRPDFVFAQGAIIHPLYYDCMIIIVFTCSIFGWGAGCVLQWARIKGVLTYVVISVSIVFVMMHLRLYALDRPSPAYNWSTDATLSPI